MHFVKKKERDCLQLSDLFTGSIYGELIGAENKIKLEIMADIKKHLKVNTIAEHMKSNKFSVHIADHI